MEEARLLVPVPDPVPHGVTGACLSCSEADEWRAHDPARFCDWVIEADPADVRATVSGAWHVWAGGIDVLWSTGLEYEQVMARLRRAGCALRSEGLTADEALAARSDLAEAARAATLWHTDPAVFRRVPDVSPEGLARLATVAWAVAHALAIRSLSEPVARAGLWRTLARTLQQAEEAAETGAPAADAALHAAAVYAETEALRQSALSHFDSCRAGAARACAARALERARAVHQDAPEVVSSKRVEELQREFDRLHSVAQKVEGGLAAGRVFDATLLCEPVDLPVV